jgi:phosphate starvation-inducible membrane PsiE
LSSSLIAYSYLYFPKDYDKAFVALQAQASTREQTRTYAAHIGRQTSQKRSGQILFYFILFFKHIALIRACYFTSSFFFVLFYC